MRVDSADRAELEAAGLLAVADLREDLAIF
jgi:hypothetical protein